MNQYRHIAARVGGIFLLALVFGVVSAQKSEAAFYAYCVPAPAGFEQMPAKPAGAYYHRELAEFILPYEAVRTARSPAADLHAFIDSTYEGAAALARWNRADLERRSA